GLAVANALNVLDLATVVLPGYLAPIADELEPVIRRTVEAHALAVEAGPVRIERSGGLADPALRGAARAALQPVFSAPGEWIARASCAMRPGSGGPCADAAAHRKLPGECRRALPPGPAADGPHLA